MSGCVCERVWARVIASVSKKVSLCRCVCVCVCCTSECKCKWVRVHLCMRALYVSCTNGKQSKSVLCIYTTQHTQCIHTHLSPCRHWCVQIINYFRAGFVAPGGASRLFLLFIYVFSFFSFFFLFFFFLLSLFEVSDLLQVLLSIVLYFWRSRSFFFLVALPNISLTSFFFLFRFFFSPLPYPKNRRFDISSFAFRWTTHSSVNLTTRARSWRWCRTKRARSAPDTCTRRTRWVGVHVKKKKGKRKK